MAKTKASVEFERSLIDVYQQHGLKSFLEVCAEILALKDKANSNKKRSANGELCEVVLWVLTNHYLKTTGYTGMFFSSVILDDKDNPKSRFRTELDSVILTPSFCLTGECKSYIGKITIVDECTLKRDSLVTDVYKQSKLHAVHLRKHLQPFVKISSLHTAPSFAMFCFLYSLGVVEDKRPVKTLPVLNLSTLYRYYDSVFTSRTKEVYDYERAVKYFKQRATSQKLHEQHRNFLGY